MALTIYRRICRLEAARTSGEKTEGRAEPKGLRPLRGSTEAKEGNSKETPWCALTASGREEACSLAR